MKDLQGMKKALLWPMYRFSELSQFLISRPNHCFTLNQWTWSCCTWEKKHLFKICVPHTCSHTQHSVEVTNPSASLIEDAQRRPSTSLHAVRVKLVVNNSSTLLLVQNAGNGSDKQVYPDRQHQRSDKHFLQLGACSFIVWTKHIRLPVIHTSLLL